MPYDAKLTSLLYWRQWNRNSIANLEVFRHSCRKSSVGCVHGVITSMRLPPLQHHFLRPISCGNFHVLHTGHFVTSRAYSVGLVVPFGSVCDSGNTKWIGALDGWFTSRCARSYSRVVARLNSCATLLSSRTCLSLIANRCLTWFQSLDSLNLPSIRSAFDCTLAWSIASK